MIALSRVQSVLVNWRVSSKLLRGRDPESEDAAKNNINPSTPLCSSRGGILFLFLVGITGGWDPRKQRSLMGSDMLLSDMLLLSLSLSYLTWRSFIVSKRKKEKENSSENEKESVVLVNQSNDERN